MSRSQISLGPKSNGKPNGTESQRYKEAEED